MEASLLSAVCVGHCGRRAVDSNAKFDCVRPVGLARANQPRPSRASPGVTCEWAALWRASVAGCGVGNV